MLNKVRDFIDRHHLLSKDRLQLVALSGGADSVALLLMLRQLGYRVEAVHCNFRLRGEESDRDEAFVKDLCDSLHTVLHRAHFDTREYAALHKVSIEMAARELRYSYFEQLRSDVDAETVCVAHHRDDAVETLLMNLMRGTGIHGLTGIRPQNRHVVRPLLCLTRQDIEDYLHAAGQSYVTDSTNLADDVLRNKLRLRLIPLMQEILPHSTENMARTADYLSEAEKVYHSAVESQISRLVSRHSAGLADASEGEGLSADIEAVRSLPSAECFLHEWLSPLGFNPTQILEVFAHLTDASDSLFLSASHQLAIARGQIVARPLQKPIPSMVFPEPGTYRYREGMKVRLSYKEDINVSKSAYCVTLDKAKVEFPLTLRAVQDGDRFHPFGMKGSKLVNDYLTDRKVPFPDKPRQMVVTDRDGDIVWLVGHRTDDRFKVDTTTTAVLEIEVLRG